MIRNIGEEGSIIIKALLSISEGNFERSQITSYVPSCGSTRPAWHMSAKQLAELVEKIERLALSHDTFSHNPRAQLKQVFDALRAHGGAEVPSSEEAEGTSTDPGRASSPTCTTNQVASATEQIKTPTDTPILSLMSVPPMAA